MNQRALEGIAVGREDHRPGRRIEVGELIVPLARRRGVLVAQADVRRQLRRDAIVVLEEVELHVLPLIHDGVAGEGQLRRQAEQQIADGAVGEPVLEVHPANRRVQVVDPRLHVEELAAELEEVGAATEAERRARVPRSRGLELRRRRVPADRVEPLHVDLGHAAHDCRIARDVLEADLRPDHRRRSSAGSCSSRRASSRTGCRRPGSARPSRSGRAPAPAIACRSRRTHR